MVKVWLLAGVMGPREGLKRNGRVDLAFAMEVEELGEIEFEQFH